MRSVVVLALLVVATPVIAGVPSSYVGKWAKDQRSCRADPEEDRAVFIRRNMMEGKEWQCNFRKVSASRTGYDISLSCAEEGTEFVRQVSWGLDNNDQTLIEEEGNKPTQTLVRCSSQGSSRSRR